MEDSGTNIFRKKIGATLAKINNEMNIAYIISHDTSTNDGVTKKILAQITEWKYLEHKVTLFNIFNIQSHFGLSAKTYAPLGYIKSRLFLYSDLLADIEKIGPSLVYIRYDSWYLTLNTIAKRFKTIVEINTNQKLEYKLLVKTQKSLKAIFRYLFHRIGQNIFLPNVTGIITVTEELSNDPLIKKFNKPNIYVPNGIDLTKFTAVKNQFNTEKRIGLFFMGTSGQSWHGIDLIKKLSYQLPEYDFHIVGIQGNSTNNLIYYPFLQKIQYIQILKKCHICLGSLALYRKGIQEACPLKVREYIAYGYPIIINYLDTAFIDSKKIPEWVFRLDINNINFVQLASFINKYKNFIIPDEEKVPFSIKETESKRIAFFNKLIA